MELNLDLKEEYENLEAAKKNLNKKLTNAFKGKWVIQTKTLFTGEEKLFKTRKGKFIIFKVESCRPRTTSISDEHYLDDLVLAGKDSLGCSRTMTIHRSGVTKSFGVRKERCEKHVYGYSVPMFESEDEARLYAEITYTE